MARVAYGQGVADIRGSVGGTVFSRNANGAYMRNRTTPFNTNSQAQQDVRNSFGAISRSWRDLTDEERQSFVDQSAAYPYTNSLGQASTYTGFQLFQKVNSQLQLIGASALTNMIPPVSLIAIKLVQFNILEVGTIEFRIVFNDDSVVVPANASLVIEMTKTLSLGINKPKRPDYKQIKILLAAAGTDGTACTAQYASVFGSLPAEGEKLFGRAFLVSTETGQTNNPMEASGITAA